MRKKTIRLKAGDVFMIPVGGGECYIGHIIEVKPVAVYIVVYEPVVAQEDASQLFQERVRSGVPWLASLALNMRLKSGEWPIVGNVEPDKAKFLPAYRLGHPDMGDATIEDFHRKFSTPVAAPVWEKFQYRTTRSAAGIEYAAQASHGDIPWEDNFDRLLYDEDYPTSYQVFGD